MEDYESGVIEVAGSSSSFSRKRIVLTVAASLGVVAIALIALGLFVGVGLQTSSSSSSEGEQVMDDSIYEEVFDDIDPEAERYDDDYITPEQYEIELQQRQQQEEISDERAERSSCSVNGFSGTCQNTYSQSCVGGAYVSGHCPGAANIRCCVRGGVAACSDGAKQGVCINTNTQSGSCRGTIVSGRCPGASNIRCCARGSSGSTSGSSSSSGGGGGRVDYRGKTVSDANVRAKLAQIAALYPSGTLYVTSGDRNNGGRSHHDVHRAADFWITGQSSGSAMFNRIRSSGILARDYQIIWHGTRTCTSGQHLHIGRYGDNRPSCWVHEGTTSSNYCKYPCI